MKKRRLLKLLERFDDDQEVFIDLHSRIYPDGSHVFIQDVVAVNPWKEPAKQLVGLVAHEGNKIIVSENVEADNCHWR